MELVPTQRRRVCLIQLVRSCFCGVSGGPRLFWVVQSVTVYYSLLGLFQFLQTKTSQSVFPCKFTKNELCVRFYYKVGQGFLQSGAAVMYYKIVQVILQSGETFSYYIAG